MSRISAEVVTLNATQDCNIPFSGGAVKSNASYFTYAKFCVCNLTILEKVLIISVQIWTGVSRNFALKLIIRK